MRIGQTEFDKLKQELVTLQQLKVELEEKIQIQMYSESESQKKIIDLEAFLTKQQDDLQRLESNDIMTELELAKNRIHELESVAKEKDEELFDWKAKYNAKESEVGLHESAREKIEELERQLQDNDQLQQQLTKSTDELDQLREALHKIETLEQTVQEQRVQLQDAGSKQDSLADQLAIKTEELKAIGDVSKFEHQIRTLEEELQHSRQEALMKIETLEQSLNEKTIQLHEAEENQNSLLDQLTTTKKEVGFDSELKEEIRTLREQLEQSQQEAVEKVERMQKCLNEQQLANADSESKISLLQEALEKVETLEQNLKEKETQFQDSIGTISELEVQIRITKDQLKQANSEIEQLQSSLKEQQQREEDLVAELSLKTKELEQETASGVKMTEEERKELENQVEDWKQKAESLNEKVQMLEATQKTSTQSTESSICLLQEKIVNLTSKLDEQTEEVSTWKVRAQKLREAHEERKGNETEQLKAVQDEYEKFKVRARIALKKVEQRAEKLGPLMIELNQTKSELNELKSEQSNFQNSSKVHEMELQLLMNRIDMSVQDKSSLQYQIDTDTAILKSKMEKMIQESVEMFEMKNQNQCNKVNEKISLIQGVLARVVHLKSNFQDSNLVLVKEITRLQKQIGREADEKESVQKEMNQLQDSYQSIMVQLDERLKEKQKLQSTIENLKKSIAQIEEDKTRELFELRQVSPPVQETIEPETVELEEKSQKVVIEEEIAIVESLEASPKEEIVSIEILSVEDQRVKVKAGCSFNLPIPANVVGSIISYSFYIEEEGADIGYSVTFQSDTTKTSEMICPYSRIHPTKDSRVKSEIPSGDSGTYFIAWDNSYSWMTDKTVIYSFKVYKNEPQECPPSIGITAPVK